MNKIIFLTFLILFTPVALWSHKHAEFQGIPLDMTISNFSSKLQQKGFKYNSKKSATNDPIRYFDGKFYGKDCELLVFYNPKSKTVYRAKVLIDCYSRHAADMLIRELKDGYDIKYGSEGDFRYEKFDVNGYPGWRRFFIDEDDWSEHDGSIGYLVIGEVQLWISYSSYTDNYTVHIDYFDAENLGKYNYLLQEDL